MTKYWGETAPKFFGCMESILEKNKRYGYFVGSKVSSVNLLRVFTYSYTINISGEGSIYVCIN